MLRPLALALLLLAPAAAAQPSQTVLQPADAAEGDFFGEMVALDGDRLAVGVRTADLGALDNAGAVYVFERVDGAWQEVAKLTAPVPDERDFFGESVALRGNWLFVGALGDDENAPESGAVFPFERVAGVWTPRAPIYPDDPQDFHGFGWELAFDGTDLFIGAPQDEAVRIQAGAVYRFRRVGGAWVQQEKLLPNSADADDISFFGTTFGVSGDWLIVGSPTDSEAATRAGAAYLFQRTGATWTQRQKLLPPPVALPDLVDEDTYGREVALDGAWAMVGSGFDDEACIAAGGLIEPNEPNNCSSGAVFAYRRQPSGEWTLEQKIIPDDVEQYDAFGLLAVDIDGTRAAIGSRGDDDACPDPPPPNEYLCDTGAVYVFGLAGGSWQQTHKLTASPANADSLDFLGGVLIGQGRPVALDGDRVVGGAPTVGITDDVSTKGKVFVFELVPPVATDGGVPRDGGLSAPYPNPFGAETALAFTLAEAGHVRLAVFDVRGREVAVVVDRALAAGPHVVPFAGEGLPSGVYLARLTVGPDVWTRRLVRVR